MVCRAEIFTNGGPCGGRAVRHRRSEEGSTPSTRASRSVVYQWLSTKPVFMRVVSIPVPGARRLDHHGGRGGAALPGGRGPSLSVGRLPAAVLDGVDTRARDRCSKLMGGARA